MLKHSPRVESQELEMITSLTSNDNDIELEEKLFKEGAAVITPIRQSHIGAGRGKNYQHQTLTLW